jgi:hypothetical protein
MATTEQRSWLEVLQHFCDAYGWRPWMKAPHTQHGNTFATNGRLIVRVLSELEGAFPLEDPAFDHHRAELFGGVPEQERFIPWAEAETFVERRYGHKCQDCGGIGREASRCSECGGSGAHECDCGEDHKCGYCEGIGYCPRPDGGKCPVCKGLDLQSVRISGLAVSGYYHALIGLHLPAVEYGATPHKDAIYFRFYGGDGLVMRYREG